MKRFVSILLVAMLIVTSLATVAFAAGAASVSGNSKNAKPGDEVTLTFRVSGEFANYELYLNPDEGLTLVSIDANGGESNVNTGKIAFAKGENITSHSFTATVKVADTAKPGKYYVKTSVDFVSDRNLTDCTVSAGSGVVIIEEPACDHAWGEWKVTKEATCTVDGVETRTCSKCGETQTRAIKAGHKIGTEWKKDSKEHWHVCTVCGEKADCAAHTWKVQANDGWETVKPSTEEEEGLKQRVCSVCSYKETDIIPASGEPDMGDITGQVTMGATAVLLLVVASVAFVFKRKTAK